MTAQQELDQLKQKREEYVRISKENNMYEGTKKILTDMYPDTAHFIYELLQNAEDMHATRVKFALHHDRLVFIHDGTKRDFIIQDIDSITSIGNNSLKKDDKTSIGKFGVGFKAVYTYTRTPEIHSGEFDFKIKDMFVPDSEGVKKIAKPGQTVFRFPFDHESKTPEQAVAEIQKGLLELDENSILFLRHIKLIEFTLPDERHGGVKLHDDEEIRKRIVRLNLDGKKQATYWYKFTSNCRVVSNGKADDYPISIAFKAKKTALTNSTDFTIDSNLKGNVCIYFPAVKEDSRLHFHINAPFASTVARDSVRACVENKTLIDGIAELVVNAIKYFKEQQMVNIDLYATLPNRRDFEHGINSYYPIYIAVNKLFAKEELIITDLGEYKKAGAVMQTNRDIASLLPSEVMEELYHRSWIPPLNPQSRELYFLADYNIQTYERRDIANALQSNPKWFDTVFERNLTNDEWFKLWYALLNEIQGINSYSHAFSKVKMIKCEDGELHVPSPEIFIRDANYKPINLKKPLYASIDDAKNQTTERAKSFLKWLGIKVLDEHADIMADIDGKTTVDADDVTIALMSVVERFKSGQDITAFVDSQLFLGRKYNNNNALYRLKASECCWDKTVGFFYQDDDDSGYVLDMSCYDAFGEEELNEIKAVFIKLGGITEIKIEKTWLTTLHPQHSQLDTANERYDSCIKVDYTLPHVQHIAEIKDENLLEESLLLWNCVVRDKNMDHHMATYRANGSRRTQFLESTVAYYLRRIDWIPDKDGKFHRPCDIKANQLHEGFVYSKDAVFLSNLGFGDESKAPNDVARILEKAGVRVSEEDKFWFSIPEEEKRKIMESAMNRKEREKLSLEEALERENREQLSGEELDDYGRDISIKKAEERARKQREEFEKGLDAESKRFKTWHYTYGSKTTSEEKGYVFHQYHGRCQICGKAPIRMHNGKNYFVAVNIIDTSRLEDRYLTAIDKGWNTLCLCPNCAAEYRHCSKSMVGLIEQIRDIKVESGRNDYIELTFVLKGSPTKIQFTPRHFIALQAAFEVFTEHEED